MMRIGALLVTAALFSACGSDDDSFTIGDPTELPDQTPPVVQHTVDRSPRTIGQSVALEARVTDRSDIESIVVFYQRETDGEAWTALPMTFEVAAPADPANSSTGYVADATAEIPGSAVNGAGMRYYIEATDIYDNVGCSPSGCRGGPHYFPLVPPR